MIRSSVSEGSPTEGVGARLKRLRLQRGLSQRDLSSPGVSYAYISRIEAGARTPSVKALRKLSQKLRVSVEYLETGRDLREVDDRELRLADAELELRLAETTAEPEEKLKKILDESVAAGDVGSAVRARVGLGLAAAQRGSHLEAVERLEAALADNGHAPLPHMRPDLYTTLGQSYAALGAPDRSVALFERCLEQIKERVPDDSTAYIRYAVFLSFALSDAGDYDRATEVVRDALSRADEETDPYTRVRQAQDARRHLELAERLLGVKPELVDRGMLRIGQSRLAELEGDANRAVELARDALALLGDFHGDTQGAAVHALARGLAAQGDVTGAIDAYRRAVDLLTVHGRRSDAGEAALESANFLREQGREDEAEPILRRAYDLGVNAESEAARKR